MRIQSWTVAGVLAVLAFAGCAANRVAPPVRAFAIGARDAVTEQGDSELDGVYVPSREDFLGLAMMRRGQDVGGATYDGIDAVADEMFARAMENSSSAWFDLAQSVKSLGVEVPWYGEAAQFVGIPVETNQVFLTEEVGQPGALFPIRFGNAFSGANASVCTRRDCGVISRRIEQAESQVARSYVHVGVEVLHPLASSSGQGTGYQIADVTPGAVHFGTRGLPRIDWELPPPASHARAVDVRGLERIGAASTLGELESTIDQLFANAQMSSPRIFALQDTNILFLGTVEYVDPESDQPLSGSRRFHWVRETVPITDPRYFRQWRTADVQRCRIVAFVVSYNGLRAGDHQSEQPLRDHAERGPVIELAPELANTPIGSDARINVFVYIYEKRDGMNAPFVAVPAGHDVRFHLRSMHMLESR